MPSRRLGLLLALLSPPAATPRPPPPIVKLAAGPDTVTTGYAEIADAEWLGGRRWAVVAPLDVTVGLVDARGAAHRAAGRRSHQGDPQPGHRLPQRRHALRGRLGAPPDQPLDPGRQVRSRRSGAVQHSRRAAAGRETAGPLVRRAEAPAGAGRQRQPRLGGRGGGEPRLRAARHPRAARPARSRGSRGRRRPAVRAAGAERHRPVGRARPTARCGSRG